MKTLSPVLLCLAFVLIGCQPSTIEVPKASDIKPVEKLSANSVALPSGCTVPNTEEGILELLVNLPMDESDPLIESILSAFDLGESRARSLFVPKSLLSSRDLSSSLQDQIAAIEQSWNSFPTKKSFAATVSLLNEALCDYILLKTGTAKVNLSAVSTNTDPLDLESLSNVSSFNGSASLGLALDSHDIPGESCVKGIKLRLNFGAEASLTIKSVYDERVPNSLNLDAAESLSIAAAVINPITNTGAIIVINADTRLKGDVDHLYLIEDPSTLLEDFDVQMSIVFSVYDAAYNQVFTKTYSSLDDLLEALGINEGWE